MQKHRSVARNGETVLPSIHLLDRPWKADALLKLPQEELRAWYENMEAGRNLTQNEITLDYQFKDATYSFVMTPAKLLLPDGTSRIIKSPSQQVDKYAIFKHPMYEIISYLQSRLEHGDVRDVRLGVTPNELLADLVSTEIAILGEFGVERNGFFERVFDRLRHRKFEAGVKITMPLDELLTAQEGMVTLEMEVKSAAHGGDIHCYYHKHVEPKDIHPSRGDIMTMIGRGDNSVIITTREEDKSYSVVEWKLKKEFEIESGEWESRQRAVKPLGRLSREKVKEFVDEAFDRKEYILKRGDRKIVFQEKGS